MRSMKTFGLWLIILTRLASACPYLDALEQNSGQRKLQMHRQRRRHRAQKPSNPTVSQPPTASTEPQPPTSPTEPTSSDDRPQPTPSDDRPLPTGSEDLATLVANARANIVDILTNEPIFGVSTRWRYHRSTMQRTMFSQIITAANPASCFP